MVFVFLVVDTMARELSCWHNIVFPSLDTCIHFNVSSTFADLLLV